MFNILEACLDGVDVGVGVHYCLHVDHDQAEVYSEDYWEIEFVVEGEQFDDDDDNHGFEDENGDAEQDLKEGSVLQLYHFAPPQLSQSVEVAALEGIRLDVFDDVDDLNGKLDPLFAASVDLILSVHHEFFVQESDQKVP